MCPTRSVALRIFAMGHFVLAVRERLCQAKQQTPRVKTPNAVRDAPHAGRTAARPSSEGQGTEQAGSPHIVPFSMVSNFDLALFGCWILRSRHH